MKLIAIDMDGTLLSSDLTISEQNVTAIMKAQEEGHIVMICSGRAKESIMKVLNAYHISCPIGASNGSIAIVDKQIVQAIYIPKQTVSVLTQLLESRVFPYKLYTNKGVYVPSNWKERVMASYQAETPLTENITPEKLERVTEEYMQLKSDHFFENVNTVLTDHSDIEIEKIFIFTLQADKRKQLLMDMQQYAGIVVTSSAPSNLEVMNEKGHKGSGLRAIARHFHVTTENTIAIGDNFNDIPMLRAAGFSIAMGNAVEEVKELCDAITLSNNENGVAQAIFKHVLYKENKV